jgi:ribosome-associated protein
MPDMGFLDVSPDLRVPLAELEFRASRSGGPGGQHVNTSSTRVEVTWDVAGSPAVSEEQRQRLLLRLASRLDGTGRLRLVSSGTRSQLRNREDVTERLREVVAQALVVPKTRKRTRTPRAAKAARLESKRRRAATKRDRQPPRGEE